MKKKVACGCLAAVIFLMMWGLQESYGWFSDRDVRVNRFCPGENDVEVQEEFPDSTVTPGAELKKEVAFTNTGTVPCYVRARYDFSSLEAEEGTEVKMGSETWKKEADGYYYYQRCVQPGERTELFMTAVRIKDEGSPREDFSLTIYTETVQSGNHTDITDAFAHLTV